MELSITLDWIAGTIKNGTHDPQKLIDWLAPTGTTNPTTARNGYTSACRTDDGVEISWNIDRPEMGTHCIISGSSIRKTIERMGISQQGLLQAILSFGVVISRLDIAKDLQGAVFDYRMVWLDLQQKRSTGTARTFNKIEGIPNGVTIYVGSRQSDRMIRLYDKAAQMGVSETSWTRLELESKGMVARGIASFLAGSENWSSVFDGQVRAMVDLPFNLSWSKFFSQTDTPVGLPKIEKRSDREKWIDTQVIPAVLEHFVDNPSSKAIARMIAALELLRTTI